MGDADVGAVLERILDRLDRLEQKVDAMALSPQTVATVDRVVGRLPAVADAAASTAQMVWDRAVAAGIDPIALAEASVVLAEKGARPETIALLTRLADKTADANKALDTVDKAQAAFAGVDVDALTDQGLAVARKLGSAESLALVDRLASKLDRAAAALDRLDALEAKLAAARIDTGALADKGLDIAVRMAQVAQGPEANALVKGPALDAPTLDLLVKLAEATHEVRSERVAPVGLFGALSAMGRPDVQKAVGFALAFAARLGAKLG